MKFKCIKGIADSENISVIVMQNDIVIFNESDEGKVLVKGIKFLYLKYKDRPKVILNHT